MPIRINLLAEQQAAEELRRKDPMKRMLYAGIAIVSLTLFFIAWTQMKVSAARNQMNTLEKDIETLDPKYKAVKNNEAGVGDARNKIASLERYSTNRFFSGTLLNAVQGAMVEKIRITEIRTLHKYTVTEPGQVFLTNMYFPWIQQPASWKIWASPIPVPAVENLVSNQFNVVTNAREFRTNFYKYTMKATVNMTNEIDKTIRAEVLFNTVPSSKEEITVELLGRDYGTPYGSTIDEFVNRLNASDFFKAKMKGRGSSIAIDRPTQPQRDFSNPTDQTLFVPFTIEMKLAERILDNE